MNMIREQGFSHHSRINSHNPIVQYFNKAKEAFIIKISLNWKSLTPQYWQDASTLYIILL